MSSILSRSLQRDVRRAYDIGKGYVTCKDEVLQNFRRLGDGSKFAEQLKTMLMSAKARVLKALGLYDVMACLAARIRQN